MVGPGDHLYFGMVNEKEKRRNYEITKIFSRKGELFINGLFYGSMVNFFYPIMGDIRTVRAYSFRRLEKTKSFFEIRKKFPDVLMPNIIQESEKDSKKHLKFERHFGEDFYGNEFILENHIKIIKKDSFLFLQNTKPTISFKLRIYKSGEFFNQDFFSDFFAEKKLSFERFGRKKETVRKILDRAKIEINYLLKNKKTSGFDYGTIFPRDWTETALLGFDDFNPEALKYIIEKSLMFVNSKGKGWHEGGVGEFAYNKNLRHLPLIDRDMTDIETRYILTFGYFPEIFINNKNLLEKIRRVASFVFKKAKNYSTIQFEKKPRFRYFKAGSWRDSFSAYLNISSCIVPFDTNAVFYPASLKIIQKFADVLKINDKDLTEVVLKWQSKKDLFRFKNKDGTSAYALALYDYKNDKDFKRLEVNHTDEAYDLVFGEPSEEDVKSFAKRILAPEYFYTKTGPLIVGKNQGYDTRQYHGEVIWLKQIGLCGMGFKRQLERKDFSKETEKILKEAIEYLFESMIYIFEYLNLLPELVIDRNGAPVLYNDQEKIEGHMNKIQLWSCEAARRIIFDYYDVTSHRF